MGQPVVRPSTIIAAADGFGLNWANVPKEEKPTNLTIRLVKDLRVRGRLLNTEGQPVVGVTVAVKTIWEPLADLVVGLQNDGRGQDSKLRLLNGPLNTLLRVAPTDKDGRFEIDGIGAERAVLMDARSETSVMPQAMVATQDGFDPKKARPNGGLGRRELFGPSFECVVEPSRLVAGTVREAGSNKPVGGAQVMGRAAGQTVKAVTDAKGNYKLIGLPKANRCLISVTPAKDAPLLSRNLEATDRPGLEPVTCDIELTRGVIVKGRVTDKATGKGVYSLVHAAPLSDNEIAGKMPDAIAHFQGVFSDEEGRFSVVTVPGANLLTAQVPGIFHRVEGVPVVPYKTAALDEADRKRVKVDEKVVAGLHIIALAGGSVETLEHNHAVKVLDIKKDVDALTCDLTVDPGKSMTVNVQDADGKPLTGALAYGVCASTRTVLPMKTATCPVFALDPEQPRQLAFLHTERKLAGFIAVRGDEKEPPTVRLSATATITGRLLDAAGQPLADVMVMPRYAEEAGNALMHVLSSPRRVQFPITDKEGRFRIEGMLPDMKFTLAFIKARGGELTEPKVQREPLKSGATGDLGDIRAKPATD